MSTHAAQPVGARTELARYRVHDEQRVIYGQRVNGIVRVTDVPAAAGGRAYLVEREIERDGYGALMALVSDYVHQSQKHDVVPMSRSPLEWAYEPRPFGHSR